MKCVSRDGILQLLVNNVLQFFTCNLKSWPNPSRCRYLHKAPCHPCSNGTAKSLGASDRYFSQLKSVTRSSLSSRAHTQEFQLLKLLRIYNIFLGNKELRSHLIASPSHGGSNNLVRHFIKRTFLMLKLQNHNVTTCGSPSNERNAICFATNRHFDVCFRIQSLSTIYGLV